MATVTHYIYSHYDPKDKEKLEKETGQLVEDGEDADPWQTESSFSAQRRVAEAPKFTAATVSYDEINEMIGSSSRPALKSSAPPSSSDVAGWYRSLSRAAPSEQQRSGTAPPGASNISSSVQPPRERRTKNNWFISRVLHAEPPSTPPTPPPSLADILAREPPPTAADQPFRPPVFLALGPTNRGWTMLQRNGWSEGEGLGADVPRHAALVEPLPTSKGKAVDSARVGSFIVKQEEYEDPWDSDGEISEVRKVDVVDLTLSDSDDDETMPAIDSPPPPPPSTPSTANPSHTTPLLTPIATVLKSDRLGIGLKAKTVGPYRASKKRVTHNQAALAAHIRANEEMQRRKALTGKGSRGFSRLAKAEAEQRRQLLASLNSS